MIRIEPNQGKIYGDCIYNSADITTSYFFINRDFIINNLKGDNKAITPNIESIELAGFNGYILQKISLPESFKTLEIQYTGSLSGKTGCCPYVREKITPEFTFIRWETFCYPFFCANTEQNLFDYISKPGESEIVIDVPLGYEIIASEKLTARKDINGRTHFIYSRSKFHKNSFNCACAKYNKISLSTGNFYLLNVVDDNTLINQTMTKALQYMNLHFGNRDITADTIYAAIPDGFGSFACSEVGVVYVQESTFNSIYDMNQIIHEFIHLGWNALSDDSVKRVRFFDEAFTSYFEMRVMEYLTCENYRARMFADHWKNSIHSGRYKLVPICEFGQYEYGELSYTIGALCLKELCELLSTEKFDEIITRFLEKYKTVPVTLNDFCNEYVTLSDKKIKLEVMRFFKDWIYTCKGYEKYLQ